MFILLFIVNISLSRPLNFYFYFQLHHSKSMENFNLIFQDYYFAYLIIVLLNFTFSS
jgi:hypothetical protein